MDILYLDHKKDCFADNIRACFENAGANVEDSYESDDPMSILEKKVSFNDAIVLGSGSGRPENSGNFSEVIDRFHEEKPIFGVCLGYQALMNYFGSEISNKDSPRHGDTKEVYSRNEGIWDVIDDGEEFVTYNSLKIDVEDCSEDLEIMAWSDDEVMGFRREDNHYIGGVQAHPDSIGSKEGQVLIDRVVEEFSYTLK